MLRAWMIRRQGLRRTLAGGRALRRLAPASTRISHGLAKCHLLSDSGTSPEGSH
jgi:hypothetical protein